MMKKDGITIKGIVSWKLTRDGKVITEGTRENLIVNAGLAEIAGLVGNSLGGTAFLALAIGTDNTAPAASQTALVAEITTNGGERGAATVTNETTTETNDTVQFVKSFTFTGGFDVKEACALNNVTSGGDMIGRVLIGPVTVVSSDVLQITYKVIFA